MFVIFVPDTLNISLIPSAFGVKIFGTIKLDKPGPEEVLIEHKAIGLNFIDINMRNGNYSIKVDLSSLILPDTFAEDKGATFTGVLRLVDGELILKAEKVQMGCPSKYEPAEE